MVVGNPLVRSDNTANRQCPFRRITRSFQLEVPGLFFSKEVLGRGATKLRWQLLSFWQLPRPVKDFAFPCHPNTEEKILLLSARTAKPPFCIGC